MHLASLLAANYPAVIMSTTRSGSTLLQLPQEIRDEIYSHYFNKRYLVFWCYCDPDVIPADLAILRTSHAISSEAMKSLFFGAPSKAITFLYDFEFDPDAEMSTPPTKEATNRMMNVEFKVLIEPELMTHHAVVGNYADETLYPASNMDPICEATIDHFTGISVIRDRFRIKFKIFGHKFYDHFLEFMKTRFFQTLKKMQGFRKLTLVLEMVDLFEEDLSIEDQQEDIGEVPAELESCLGPCVSESFTHYLWLNNLHLVYELEFHPVTLPIGSLQTKAAGFIKEVKSS